MMMLSEASVAMNGHLVGTDALLESVDFDTRRLDAGALYFAIHGDAKNGHEFAAQAIEKGAVGVVCDEAFNEDDSTRHIKVKDTTIALGDLAADWRSQFELPVIGITGSNGKTTVTQIVKRILSEHIPGVAPQGSFNNQWGVPLTLLKLRSEHQSAVIEMGMNHPGELKYLGDIVKPTIVLITNAAGAHLEGLKTIEGVAKAKGEIIDSVSKDGMVILNRDDHFYQDWKMRAQGKRVISFGESADADIQLISNNTNKLVVKLFNQQHAFDYALIGKHNQLNGVAAIAVALAADVPVAAISTGLKEVTGEKGRLQPHQLSSEVLLIDDTYNANQASMQAAIDVLAVQSGQTILVLGAMGELGDDAESAHQQVGQYAKSKGVDYLLLLVDQATPEYMNNMAAYAAGFGNKGFAFARVSQLTQKISTLVSQASTVLVKGSRFAQMERVVEALQNQRGVTC